ncbi:hypothetical protein [Pseudoduganella violaceinigra]|uniref:hypothetical protein n=1 Tax=Pseudoduganella violaceinigra TaxID=246602 RepID=UPI0012B6088F|nr:hypothetical protein [Pseudoduganella violaceinigra]
MNQIQRLKSLFFLILISISLQGCVALFKYGEQTTQTEMPSVLATAKSPSALTSEPPVISAAADKQNGRWVATPSSSWMRDNWGNPTRLKIISDKPKAELWTYEFEKIWGGVMPVLVVLPIPLRAPTGREKIEFLLEEDRVIRATVTRAKDQYGGAFLFSPDGPFVKSLE